MVVVLSAIWYPVAIARYFLNALRRRDDVTVVTAGIDSGTYIPWGGGMHLSAQYTIHTDFTLPMRAVQRRRTLPISIIENKLPADLKPDLWINIDAGFSWTGHPKYGRVALVETDPHALDYRVSRRYADDVYCMQTPYIRAGEKYLPYAYDKEYHRRLQRGGAEFDIGFVGVVYNNRRRFLSGFSDKRINAVTGVAYDDARSVYKNSVASFNLSSKQDLAARVFELAAMGVPFVANNVPDMKTIFGDGIYSFDNIPSGQTLLRDMLNDKAMQADAISRGTQAVQGHTYDARIKQILNGEDYG